MPGVPFRIGVMQLTMEPLGEILDHARALDRNGFDTIWLAEAYPWWRKHSMEARSSTAISALIARDTERLTVGWGIISPFTRHPIQVAMDARVTQEAAGPGRFLLGFGASRIFMKEIGAEDVKPLHPTRDSVRIVRGVLGGEPFDYEGPAFTAHVPGLAADAQAPRDAVPIYVAGTGPRMQEYAGEEGDGLLTASITTPEFVRYSRANMARGAAKAGRDVAELDLGCDDRRLDRPRSRSAAATAPVRSPACTSPTRCRTSRARPTCCSSSRASARRRSARSPTRWSAAAASRRPPRSATRSSTSAGRSRGRRRTASPRSRSTARPAART